MSVGVRGPAAVSVAVAVCTCKEEEDLDRPEESELMELVEVRIVRDGSTEVGKEGERPVVMVTSFVASTLDAEVVVEEETPSCVVVVATTCGIEGVDVVEATEVVVTA